MTPPLTGAETVGSDRDRGATRPAAEKARPTDNRHCRLPTVTAQFWNSGECPQLCHCLWQFPEQVEEQCPFLDLVQDQDQVQWQTRIALHDGDALCDPAMTPPSSVSGAGSADRVRDRVATRHAAEKARPTDNRHGQRKHCGNEARSCRCRCRCRCEDASISGAGAGTGPGSVAILGSVPSSRFRNDSAVDRDWVRWQ